VRLYVEVKNQEYPDQARGVFTAPVAVLSQGVVQQLRTRGTVRSGFVCLAKAGAEVPAKQGMT